MHLTQKTATCCYCGAQTVLTLSGRSRHELACARCGAPLRQMKRLRPHVRDHAPSPSELAGRPRKLSKRDRGKPRKRRKPKPMASRLFDVAEEIFDIFD